MEVIFKFIDYLQQEVLDVSLVYRTSPLCGVIMMSRYLQSADPPTDDTAVMS